MAWLFDGTNDYVDITDNAALTLPDGDWTVAGWAALTDLTGSEMRLIFDNWDGGNNYLELFIGTNSSANPNDVSLDGGDNDGTTIGAVSTSNPFGDTDWHHIIIQRSGTTITVYVDNTSVASDTEAAFDVCNGGVWRFGAAALDWTTTQRWNGVLTEWAKWDRALDSTERGNISNGTLAYSPNFYSTNLSWYVPMYSGDYTEKIVGITVTNNGTTSATHPPVAYPLSPPVLSVTPTLHAPALEAGSVNLAPPLHGSTVAFFGPTLSPGSVSIEAPLLTNTPTFFGPTLSQEVTLGVPLLSVAPQFFSPTLSPGGVNLTAPLLTNTPTSFGPTLAVGSVSLQPPLLDVSPTFYGPSLSADITLEPPLFSIAPTFFGPTLIYDQAVTAPLLTITPIFYGHTIRNKWNDADSLTVGSWSNADTLTSGIWSDTDFPFTEG